jgi:Protein of unknown function (DUF3025)
VTTDAALAAPFFASVRSELDHLAGRRDLQSLNQLAASRGCRMRFVASPADISAVGYETGIAATGEVPTRDNLHDFFNALQWIAFPLTKTAINAGHLRHLAAHAARRPPERDVLTMIDESGVLVACEDASLLTLLREFRWKQLFVDRRDEVIAMMRFALIGHGLMERSLAPFIGLTGKAILLNVARDASLDAAVAEWIGKDANLSSSHNLAPLPLLGIPGWDARNNDPAFYDNTHYFRPGRMAEKSRMR